VIAAVDRVLAPYGGTGAYGRTDHLSDMFVSSEIEETQVTGVLIPAIFLGVTAFLLNMVLARLVATQRDQIAVLKAFGYDTTAVALHYLQLGLGPGPRWGPLSASGWPAPSRASTRDSTSSPPPPTPRTGAW
jgi:putative ABC transport system permease protein